MQFDFFVPGIYAPTEPFRITPQHIQSLFAKAGERGEGRTGGRYLVVRLEYRIADIKSIYENCGRKLE